MVKVTATVSAGVSRGRWPKSTELGTASSRGVTRTPTRGRLTNPFDALERRRRLPVRRSPEGVTSSAGGGAN